MLLLQWRDYEIAVCVESNNRLIIFLQSIIAQSQYFKNPPECLFIVHSLSLLQQQQTDERKNIFCLLVFFFRDFSVT